MELTGEPFDAPVVPVEVLPVAVLVIDVEAGEPLEVGLNFYYIQFKPFQGFQEKSGKDVAILTLTYIK